MVCGGVVEATPVVINRKKKNKMGTYPGRVALLVLYTPGTVKTGNKYLVHSKFYRTVLPVVGFLRYQYWYRFQFPAFS